MANHTTGAQRRNARMEKIFDRAKSEGRGLNGDSKLKGHGVNSVAMTEARKGFAKSKALGNAKRETKSEYIKRHGADLLKYETN